MASISLEGLSLKLRTKSKEDDAFLTEKLKIIYEKLDFDRKGYVQQEDFVNWGKEATKIAGVASTDYTSWMAAYDVYFGRSKNFKEWKLHYLYRTMKTEGLAESQLKINLPLLEALDVNSKGFISWNEYKSFVMPLGATEAEAHVGFGSIDTNGDGEISYEEFSYAYTMYHTDRSDSKYKHFWGEFQSDDSFLIEKLRRFYKMFDFQGNGYVTKKDCTTWLEKITKNVGADKVTTEVKGAWSAWFDAYFGNTKSFDEWKGHWLTIARNTKDLREYAETINTPIFKAMDTDGNGTISWKEYKAFVMPLGTKEGEAHMGFWAIDLNGDGVISVTEFSNACTKYFTERTDSRYKHFFGEYKPNESFQIEKLKRFYQKADFTNNGFVQREDMVMWVDKAAAITNACFTDELRNHWADAFGAYFSEAKNFGEYKDLMLNVALKMPGLISAYEQLALPVFKAIDVSKNGVITWEEYKAFVMPLGATEAEAHIGFGAVDDNGDGVLSYEEFSFAGAMYYMDMYDSKYKHFYGEWKENDS